MNKLLPLLLLYLALTTVRSQGYFDYYDSILETVSSPPFAGVADKQTPPLYVTIKNPSTSNAQLWNYNTRNLVRILTSLPIAHPEFSADNNFMMFTSMNASSGKAAIQVWQRNSSNNFTQYKVYNSSTSGNYGVSDLNYAVQASANNPFSVLRFNKVTGVFISFQNISNSLTPVQLYPCSNGSWMVFSNDTDPKRFTLALYGINSGSGQYELKAQQTFNQAVNQSILYSAANNNASLFVYYANEVDQANATIAMKIKLLVSFGQGYIRLPSIPVTTPITSLTVNSDGSAFGTTSSEVIEYAKDTDASSNDTAQVKANCDWYYTAYICNCSNDPNSNSNGMNTNCSCQSPSVWTGYACGINCSTIANTSGTVNATTCQCKSGFVWNTNGTCTASSSSSSCANDPGSTGYNSTTNPSICQCKSGYYWNSGYSVCYLNCSTGTLGNANATSCQCQSGYYWNSSSSVCYLNCSSIDGAQGNADAVSCQCAANKDWNSTSVSCYINCSRMHNTAGGVSPDGVNCNCPSEWVWDDTYGCLPDCESQPHATGIAPDNSSCLCNTGYYWDSGNNNCYLNCSSVSNAAGNSNSTSCNCNSGYNWDSTTTTCLKNASTSSSKVGLIVGIAVPCGFLALSLIGIGLYCCCRPAPAYPMMPMAQMPPPGMMPMSAQPPYSTAIPTAATMYSQAMSNPGMGSQAALFGQSSGSPFFQNSFSMPRAKQPAQDATCAVCLAENTNCITNCYHRFHRACLLLWMTKDRSCPMCRNPNLMIL